MLLSKKGSSSSSSPLLKNRHTIRFRPFLRGKTFRKRRERAFSVIGGGTEENFCQVGHICGGEALSLSKRKRGREELCVCV